MLVICETHPVQYHAPVYRAAARLGVPLHVIYGSNFSIRGYRDAEFQANFAWDTDLLSGYSHSFVNTVENGGPQSYEQSTDQGLLTAIQKVGGDAIMALGYRIRFDRGVLASSRHLRSALLMRSEASDQAIRRSWIKNLVRDGMLKRLYGRCRSILYVGKNALEHYRRLGVPSNKLFFSPYCVSTEAFQCDEVHRSDLRRSMRSELGIAQDDHVVLYCGKLSKRKGVDLLLQAVKRLPASLRNKTVLLFVGEGVLRTELESESTQGEAVRIHISGFKNQSQLSPYYHASDVAVLPSITSETWGLVVNEALHHGLPSIVSDQVGSAPDLIDTANGQVVMTGDVTQLSSAIESSLLKPESAESRERRRQFIDRYSVEVAAKGIADAYASIHHPVSGG